MPMPTETDALRIEALRRQRKEEVRNEGAPVSVVAAGGDAGGGHHHADPHVLDDDAEAECGQPHGRTPSRGSDPPDYEEVPSDTLLHARSRPRRWDGLWRKGAGTAEDPNNGRLILRILGVHPSRWTCA